MKYIDSFRNREAAIKISEKIKAAAEKIPDDMRIMEVCGSHTMSIAKYAIREILPSNIKLISGPGCPVCVTGAEYIDQALELAKEGKIIATFGDMINVPGSETNLAKCRSEGAEIEVCYSPSMSTDIAQKNPERELVFLGIGFETTAPTVVSIVDSAIRNKIKNISVLTAFKLVPPALEALVSDPELKVDAFLCPAHVSAIIGADAYEPFVKKHGIPCVIAGFEPLDILFGLLGILEQKISGNAFVDNQYSRVVKKEGNKKAQELIKNYLEICDAEWRGIGKLPQSGMRLKEKYSGYDATKKFKIKTKPAKPSGNCKCGDVLKGKIQPPECPLFGAVCTPLNPIGPCMVSSEGSCAASYKYSRK
jgi:hydrogenase expression/formation protein HypD